MTDTDSDPDTVDVIVPSNDDSIKAIEILLDQLAQAVAEGKTMIRAEDVTSAAAAQRTERPRSRRRVLASAQDGDSEPAAAEPAAAEQPQPETTEQPASETAESNAQ